MTADRETRRTGTALAAVLVAGVVALVALVGVAAPAGAQYIPGQPGIIIDPPTLPETGGSANIKGFGCPPAVPVDGYIVINGTEIYLGTAISADDPDGSFVIPVSFGPTPVGEYTILAKCTDLGTDAEVAPGEFGVSAAAPVTLTLSTILTFTPVGTAAVNNGTLPVTGSNTAEIVRVAALLIAVGGFAALVVRKRRNSLTR